MTDTTLLVLGAPRSGTSMIAGVLHRLGTPMGSDYGRYEDPHFMMQSLSWETTDQIALNNATHSIWGCKTVTTSLIGAAWHLFRNPRMIYAQRDLRTRIARRPNEQFWLLLDVLHELSGLMSAKNPPLLVIDFDEALNNPSDMVNQIIAYAGLEPTPAQVAEAVAFVGDRSEYPD